MVKNEDVYNEKIEKEILLEIHKNFSSSDMLKDRGNLSPVSYIKDTKLKKRFVIFDDDGDEKANDDFNYILDRLCEAGYINFYKSNYEGDPYYISIFIDFTNEGINRIVYLKKNKLFQFLSKVSPDTKLSLFISFISGFLSRDLLRFVFDFLKFCLFSLKNLF